MPKQVRRAAATYHDKTNEHRTKAGQRETICRRDDRDQDGSQLFRKQDRREDAGPADRTREAGTYRHRAPQGDDDHGKDPQGRKPSACR